MSPSRFLFHANAIGVTGQIHRPVSHLIPSVASALPPGGGYNNAKQDPGEFLEIYSHGGATTATTGNQKQNGDAVTTAIATVHGLNIRNVVLLDSVTASLSSLHPADGSQARFNTQGSFFQNLRIAGHEIELESRIDLYGKLATLADLCEAYKENTYSKGEGHFKKEFVFQNQFLEDAFAPGHVGKEKALHEKQHKYFPYRDLKKTEDLPCSRSTGVTIVPLFIVKNPSEPGFHVSGNVITVENFGTVVLGELIISAYERRLTMLHAELGSPVGGMVSACSLDGNGGGVDP
jgi:hypothetical protein